MGRLFRLLLGITAVFFFACVSLVLAQEPTPLVTPTIDRLAAPPTVPAPTQADEGAQLFWLHCQPCHGDQGQGLTDEWRAQYPEEDRNCWGSGCHGKRPYADGFILPTTVPPVIGGNSLSRFENLAQLYGYVRLAMPYEFPGTLKEDEYLAITAFLGRAHYIWDGTPLTRENAVQYRLHPEVDMESTPMVVDTADSRSSPLFVLAIVGGGVIASLIVGGFWLWQQRRPVQ